MTPQPEVPDLSGMSEVQFLEWLSRMLRPVSARPRHIFTLHIDVDPRPEAYPTPEEARRT